MISFDLAYIFGVSRLYGYLGVTLNINWGKFVVSSIVILVTILILPVKGENVSAHLFFVLYSITFLPTASYFWMNDKPLAYFMELSICFIFIEMFIRFNTNGRRRIKVGNGNFLLSLVLTVYILSAIALIIKNGGFNVHIADFGVASQARENNISGFAGYLLNWCAKSFMPLFVAYFGFLKKKKWVIFISLLQIGLFFSYGFKTFLLSVVYLIIMSYALKAGWKYWKTLPALFSGLNVIALFCYTFKITNIILFLFPFRTLALPSEGQFRYYEYFRINVFLTIKNW